MNEMKKLLLVAVLLSELSAHAQKDNRIAVGNRGYCLFQNSSREKNYPGSCSARQ